MLWPPPCELEGRFDLVLVGRNSLDGDTGQVGPEVAQLTGLPFAAGVRDMGLEGEDLLSLTLEHDDGCGRSRGVASRPPLGG